MSMDNPIEETLTTLQAENSSGKNEEASSSQPQTQTKDRDVCSLQGAPAGLSKTQRKKWLKRQRWNDQKAERRAFERRKKKENRQASIALGIPQPVSRKRLKVNTMESSSCKVKVAIDCSFDDLMTEKDICHLVKQLNHCYAVNRRCPNPAQMYVTSINGKTLERLESLGDYKGWDVNFETRDYETVFGKENVVYLSSDSPNMLQCLSDKKVYIIGGLVDHNHQKGLCHRLAEEKGVAHAQLPIGEYLELKTRKVLTINHVFEILVKFAETNSWEESFFKVIPNRKVNRLKVKDNQEGVDNEEQVKEPGETDLAGTDDEWKDPVISNSNKVLAEEDQQRPETKDDKQLGANSPNSNPTEDVGKISSAQSCAPESTIL